VVELIRQLDSCYHVLFCLGFDNRGWVSAWQSTVEDPAASCKLICVSVCGRLPPVTASQKLAAYVVASWLDELAHVIGKALRSTPFGAMLGMDTLVAGVRCTFA
jgi:hypothetical protein